MMNEVSSKFSNSVFGLNSDNINQKPKMWKVPLTFCPLQDDETSQAVSVKVILPTDKND